MADSASDDVLKDKIDEVKGIAESREGPSTAAT